MQRVTAISPETTTGKTRELLDGVNGKLGVVPNITRTMANSPAVLDAYTAMSGALGNGLLSAQFRECIALIVAEKNGCSYCLAAHTAIGTMAGLSEVAEIVANVALNIFTNYFNHVAGTVVDFPAVAFLERTG